MIKKIFALFIAVAAISLASASSESGKYADISHDQLKAALAAGTVTAIDVNGSESYAEGHIPGALNYEAVKADLAAKLPADKGALIVAYCGGPRCTAYRQAYDAAVALGYTNVKHYSGGISGWEEKGEKTEKN
jgi:rhodanese-related sulfurtransferase